MNKIGDGKNHFGIDLKNLFSRDNEGASFNKKMLIIRCSVGLFAVILTIILTLAFSGGFKKDGGDESVGSFSELEDNTQDTMETESENNTVNVGEQSTEAPSQNIGGNEEYVDLSYKEHGELYVINKTGNPIVYDPYANYEKYYDQNDMRPIVLVLHTDNEQRYVGDNADIQSVVSIGEKIAQGLSLAGVPAIHCSAEHSGDTDTDSYNNAEESIEFYLSMYPSIKYILDVGLDSENDYIPKGVFDRSSAAQILFDVCGQNYDTREQNLHLAVKLRGMLNRGNMSVAREIILSRSVLNSRFTPYYLTVRIGTENNTSKEAINSANALVLTFAEYINKQ